MPPFAPRPSPYLRFALLGLAVVAAGFFTTYLRPVWQGHFSGGGVHHLHGALLLAWLLLFTVQSWLVSRRAVARHRSLGVLALALVPAIVASTLAVAMAGLQRDFPAQGEAAVSAVLGSVTSPLIFAGLVGAALVLRRKPEYHKRLMLLATLAILWPAFFRLRHYFPSVPRPDLVFGVLMPQLLVLVAMLTDWRQRGRVHPVYLWVGLPLMAEAFVETLLFDSAGWRIAARWVVDLLGGMPG